jgi:hypothetical protein
MSKDEEFIKLWLRWAFNFILLLVLLVVTGFTVAGLAAIATFGFWKDFSLSTMIQLALLLVTFFVGVRVVVDSVKIFDRLARGLLSRIPIFTGRTGPRRLLAEAAALVLISLPANAAISFLHENAPEVVPVATLVLSVFILVLAYDVSKSIYLIIETPVHNFARMIAKEERESEEVKEKSKSPPDPT